MTAHKPLDVQIWSDVACPWCYVGKRRFEAALGAFEHRDQVRTTWRSFELDPSAPREQSESVSYARRLGAKYGGADLRAMDGPDGRRVVVTVEPVRINAVDLSAG